MLADGEEGQWVPEARVKHILPKHRLTVRYLRGFWCGAGQAKAMLDRAQRRDGRGASVWTLAFQALRSEAKYRLLRLGGDPKTWLKQLKIASEAWGRLKVRRIRSLNDGEAVLGE
jgi:hypothetical protein